LVSVAGLAMNPAGFRYFTAAFDLGTRIDYRSHIAEWQPLPISFLMTAPGIAFGAALLTWGAQAGWRRRLDAEVLVGAMSIVLAVHAVRFVPIAAIALAPGVARGLNVALEVFGRRLRTSDTRVQLWASCLALMSTPFAYALTTPRALMGLGVPSGQLPAQAASFLLQHPPPGSMWNAYDYGGYLIYRLWPEQKVFIDGRLETVYTPEFFLDYIRARRLPAKFDDFVTRYDIGYVVIRPNGELPWLHANSEWATVYLDDAAAILVRRTNRAKEYLDRHAYVELRADTAIARARALMDDPKRQQFEKEVMANAQRAPDALSSRYLVALIHRAAGRQSAYAVERARVTALAAERGLELPLP
jgi:hypothetical protein